jgi:hypothetical protein
MVLDGYVRHSRYVIDIRLVHHCSHCFRNISLPKLELRMLFPHRLQIKEWSTKQRLQKGQTSRVRNACASLVVVLIAWKYPSRLFLCIFVSVRLEYVFREWCRIFRRRSRD